mmetsp:Transcript_35903/g.101018  ORF Transcript_35903/g.101018 Transcript_35903/m.101018 type:complete len:306 (-) Transcript_35903:20-937(-)
MVLYRAHMLQCALGKEVGKAHARVVRKATLVVLHQRLPRVVEPGVAAEERVVVPPQKATFPSRCSVHGGAGNEQVANIRRSKAKPTPLKIDHRCLKQLVPPAEEDVCSLVVPVDARVVRGSLGVDPVVEPLLPQPGPATQMPPPLRVEEVGPHLAQVLAGSRLPIFHHGLRLWPLAHLKFPVIAFVPQVLPHPRQHVRFPPKPTVETADQVERYPGLLLRQSATVFPVGLSMPVQTFHDRQEAGGVGGVRHRALRIKYTWNTTNFGYVGRKVAKESGFHSVRLNIPNPLLLAPRRQFLTNDTLDV